MTELRVDLDQLTLVEQNRILLQYQADQWLAANRMTAQCWLQSLGDNPNAPTGPITVTVRVCEGEWGHWTYRLCLEQRVELSSLVDLDDLNSLYFDLDPHRGIALFVLPEQQT